MADQFENDLLYLISEESEMESPAGNSQIIEKKETPNNSGRTTKEHRLAQSIDSKIMKPSRGTLKIKDILQDLADLELSSDEDDEEVMRFKEKLRKGKKKESGVKRREVAKEKEIVESKSGGESTDAKANSPDVAASEKRRIRNKNRSERRKKERQALKVLEDKTKSHRNSVDGDQKIVDSAVVVNSKENSKKPNKLTRKQTQKQKILADQFNVHCETAEEVEMKAKELGVVLPKVGGNKNGEEKAQDPRIDTKIASKTRSVLLLTNSAEYYREHTVRDYDIKELAYMALNDELFQTIVLKASPKLKKLIEILILNSHFFTQSKPKVSLFVGKVIQIALNAPRYLSGQRKVILEELYDPKSEFLSLLTKFGPEMIDHERDFINIDSLTLLGNILIWYCRVGRLPKKLLFKLFRFGEAEKALLLKNFSHGSHLWDSNSYKEEGADDEYWETLEKLRHSYRYEEDQFYAVLRLLDIRLEI